MYAIIETGGKQYRVTEGDVIFIEKLQVEAEQEVIFDKVVAINNDSELVVGNPYIDGATVKAVAIKNGKGRKITVFTYKPKKGKQRKLGHRQPYSQVQIEAIFAEKPKAKRAAKPKAAKVEETVEQAVEAAE